MTNNNPSPTAPPILTLSPSVWVLEISWDRNPEMGVLMYQRTSIHKDKAAAERRINRIIQEITGSNRHATLAISQNEGNTYADLEAGGGYEFSYSLQNRQVED